MSNLLADSILYLLAIMNPISKVFIVSVLSKDNTDREIRSLAFTASLVGLFILLIFAFAGKFILNNVFHVDLHSFKIAGGVVLFMMGYKALTCGVFFEFDIKAKLKEASIVPLASPMIAGPGTITAVVGLSVEHGFNLTAYTAIIVVILNLAIMLLSGCFSKFLLKFNFMGALIRITGLVVMTIGVNMCLDGFQNWVAKLSA